MKNRNAVILFVTLAFVWSWGLLAIFLNQGGTAEAKGYFLLYFAYIFGPGVSALAVQGLVVKEPAAQGVGAPIERSTWLVFAWFMAPALALVILALSALWPGLEVSFSPLDLLARDVALIPPDQLEEARAHAAEANPLVVFFSQFAGAMLFGTLLLGFVSMFQEVGWRGFLVNKLAPLGFWTMSLVVGVVSALWYVPLVLYGGEFPDDPVRGALVSAGFWILVSPLACWVRLRSGSMLAAAVLVGGLKAFSRLVFFFTIGGDEFVRGVVTWPGLVVLAAAVVLLFATGTKGANEALRKLVERGV